MYFEQFPTITYPFEINGQMVAKRVTDITVNVRVFEALLQYSTAYDEYDIVDGETPEIISEKVYGSPLYHWVIMIINQRYDYVKDFPLPQYEFEQYVKDKYGEENMYDVHHYVDSNGFIVNQDNVNLDDEFDAVSVSNYEYEIEVNESKRRIKLISSANLFQILAQFKNLL